ncbi:hypothetical protein LTR91_015520 [Friedmanniomyces endolithicus]|uniref:Uncharacterized protein n=1 Tax=Friedmanniomyces endolithicus TaxID=329885 RepID=A0AAN6K9L5_9PEZI|nr:hypothetical protein LTR94_008677 [Friedmanniomyces endolithicus]KAK0775807.1 hypothetical protein LTR59_014394 [Friedmanniomyces endolithicus]KAK0795529.1 hypothetical protein LTR38_008858 [Friedmanniomyces endolithicus]KAK0817698.1 hypothetical protein LTR75_003033 [Friedmanniomyces endolithicus]KAK0871299.1 hypothetical protein LTS02_001943 [Friedmanniomyces endolithicus]
MSKSRKRKSKDAKVSATGSASSARATKPDELESDFTAEEKPVAKKSRMRPTNKKQIPNTTLTNANGPIFDPRYTLDPLPIEVDNRMKSLRRWQGLIEAGIHVKKGAVLNYTPSEGAMRHVHDLPVYDGRDFKLVEDRFGLYSLRKSDGQQVQAWRLEVRDHSREGSMTVQPFCCLYTDPDRRNFGIPTAQYDKNKSRVVHFNAIEKSVCKDEKSARELAYEVCRVMNRIPGDLKLPNWIGRSPKGGQRRLEPLAVFAESVALLTWNPRFDVRTLDRPFFDADNVAAGNGSSRYTLCIYPAIYSKKPCFASHHGPRMVITEDLDTATTMAPTPRRSGGADRIATYHGHHDPTVASALPAPLTSNIFAGVYTGTQILPAEQVAFQVHRYLMDQLFGKIGTARQYAKALNDLQQPLIRRIKSAKRYAIPTVARRSGGPLNDGPVLGKSTDRGSSFYFNPAKQVVLSLAVTDPNRSLTTDELAIFTASKNPVHHAYIHQQALHAIAADRGSANALQDAQVAAALIDIGQLKLDDILATFCTCEPDERALVQHPCMGPCRHVWSCSEMVVDDKQRRLCLGCAQNRYIPEVLEQRLAQTIRGLATKSWQNDKEHGCQMESYSIIEEAVRPYLSGSDTFICAYTGSKVSLSDATLREGALRAITKGGRAIQHPQAPSIERTQRYVAIGNKIFGHHPKNLVLVQRALNWLKGSMIVAFMPWLGRAARLYDELKTETPQVGYPQPHQEFYSTMHAAADNALMIFRQEHKRYPTASEVRHVARFTRSGIWDGKHGDRTLYFNTCGLLQNMKHEAFVESGKRVDYAPWTAPEIEQIKRIIRDFESSEKYNPGHIEIPRGPHGVPWFWIPAEMGHGVSWLWMFQEMRGRLYTMEEECDREGDTDETPVCMLFEYVVQYLENAGKDHIFGCEMSVTCGHPLVQSIGRGIYATDDDGHWVRDISAGELMRTGCTTLFLSNIDEYRLSRRTICRELWRTNAFRQGFQAGSTTISTLSSMAASILEESKHWDKPKATAAEYTKVVWPKSRPTVKEHHRVTSSEDLDHDELEDEDHDEELATMAQAKAQKEIEFKDTFEDEVAGSKAGGDHGSDGEDDNEDDGDDGDDGGDDGGDDKDGGSKDEVNVQGEGKGKGKGKQRQEDTDIPPIHAKLLRDPDEMDNIPLRPGFRFGLVDDKHPAFGYYVEGDDQGEIRWFYPREDNRFVDRDGMVLAEWDDTGNVRIVQTGESLGSIYSGAGARSSSPMVEEQQDAAVVESPMRLEAPNGDWWTLSHSEDHWARFPEGDRANQYFQSWLVSKSDLAYGWVVEHFAADPGVKYYCYPTADEQFLCGIPEHSIGTRFALWSSDGRVTNCDGAYIGSMIGEGGEAGFVVAGRENASDEERFEEEGEGEGDGGEQDFGEEDDREEGGGDDGEDESKGPQTGDPLDGIAHASPDQSMSREGGGDGPADQSSPRERDGNQRTGEEDEEDGSKRPGEGGADAAKLSSDSYPVDDDTEQAMIAVEGMATSSTAPPAPSPTPINWRAVAMAKLQPRFSRATGDQATGLVSRTMISYGMYPHVHMAYAMRDHKYKLAGGEIVATWEDDGKVFDVAGNFLGAYK